MARMNQGILGGLSGSIGNVVGSSWKGINVLKSKPLSVANPRTAGQIAQRSKMANIVEFAKVINTSVIKPLWDRFASKMSGYNAFVSENIHLFGTEMPDPYTSFIISKGKMESTPVNAATVSAASGNVQIDWDDESGDGYKLADDECYIVAFNVITKEIGFSAAEYTRVDEQAIVNIPGTNAGGHNVRLYMAFRRADGTVVSNTAVGSSVFS